MAKIDAAKFKAGARHTVKVSLTFEENGARTTEQIAVVYRGISLAEAEQISVDVNANENKRKAVIQALVQNVLELPDIIENGQPVAPTAEFFDTLDTYFLSRINQAIIDDRQGNG